MKKLFVKITACAIVLSMAVSLTACTQKVVLHFVDKDGNELNLFNGISVNTSTPSADTNTTAAQTTPDETSAPATENQSTAATPETQPAATQSASSGETPATQPSSTETATQGSSSAPANSKADIVKAVNTAVTALKSEQNFKAQKTEKTVINIKECSISSLTNMLNSICQNVAGETVVNYDFVNGEGIGNKADGKQENSGNPKTVKQAVPPANENFNLSETAVKDAKAEKSGDNTVYTITLVPEESTLEKAPAYNSATVGFLNLGSFNIPTVTMTQADINYAGTIITITVNGSGKVVALKYDQPMDGTMGVKVTLISGSIVFDGGNYVSWTFSY